MSRLPAALIGLALLFPAEAGAQAYLVPPDNPFVGQSGAAPEVWAFGFRNPYRFSFDRATGDLVVADVGSGGLSGREEVNLIPRGQSGVNFGWPCREGDGPGAQPCDAPGAVSPVFSYPTTSPAAIVGGYVVRDPALGDLTGRYLYADFYDGDIRSIRLDRGAPDDRSTGVSVDTLSSFGEDSQGRLYAADLGGGGVYRLLGREQVGTFDGPIYVTAPAGDASRLFVVEREGRIRVVVEGVVVGEPFLDISSQVSTGSERGMQSMAFPPDYSTSGRLYVFYTDRGGDLRVDEFRRSADPNRADPGSQRSLLVIEHSAQGNHNGGQLQFGPDGYLYVSTGDGGGQGDVERDAQNPGSLLGKVLRIDPDPSTPGPSLPADTAPPGLTARARARQRVLRRRGASVAVSCDEPCTVSVSGRLRIGRRSYPLRAASTQAAAGRRLVLRVRLTARAARALRRALRARRRASVRLTVQARDGAGNIRRLRRLVRVRP